ncbi:hypothetical protein MPRS_16110 [Mycobacterium paraseoulense]|nr:hypothetical protein MPRS_16110 [Mycobacterium paraseoulense]
MSTETPSPRVSGDDPAALDALPDKELPLKASLETTTPSSCPGRVEDPEAGAQRHGLAGAAVTASARGERRPNRRCNDSTAASATVRPIKDTHQVNRWFLLHTLGPWTTPSTPASTVDSVNCRITRRGTIVR